MTARLLSSALLDPFLSLEMSFLSIGVWDLDFVLFGNGMVAIRGVQRYTDCSFDPRTPSPQPGGGVAMG